MQKKAKPATDKIYEGASFIGNHVKSAYDGVKEKIMGESPQQNIQSLIEDKNINNNQQLNELQNDNISEKSQASETTSTTNSLQTSHSSLISSNYKEI